MNLLPWAIIGPQEMMIVGIGILVLFGAKKLPELARGMGEGMKEFKKAVREVSEDEPVATTATPAAPIAPAVTTPAAPNAAPTISAVAPAPDSPEDIEKRIVH